MSLRTIYGQAEIGAQLQEIIRSGRISHAYCFHGAPGTGALEMAVEMAKALFCEQQNGDACGQCSTCRRIAHQNFPAVQILDGTENSSIKIEQVRRLQAAFSYRSMETERKVYIIHPAEKLTTAASNALLKFLEEPDSQVVAILVTAAPQQLLSTILSRCQLISFPALPYGERVSSLEQEGFPSEAAHLALRLCGDYSQARELCATEWFAEVRSLVLELIQDVLRRSGDPLWLLQDRLLAHPQVKANPTLVIELMLIWFRDLLQMECRRPEAISYVQQKSILNEFSKRFTRQQILHFMDILLMTRNKMDTHVNQQLALEWMILRLQEG